MSNNVQLVIVALLVGGAALYVLRSAWRLTRGKSTGCCSKGCGTDQPKESSSAPVVSSEELLQSLQRRQTH